MTEFRESIPDNTILVDLCVYCTNCRYVLRLADAVDMNGTLENCPECDSLQPIIVGIHVSTNEEQLLKYVYNQFMSPIVKERLKILLESRGELEDK